MANLFSDEFTGIIYNKEKLLRGTIVASICQQVHTITIEDIDDSTNFDELLEHTFEASFLQNKTMFVFVDGLSKYISSLIESMLNCYGLLPNYIGGGAGSIFGEKPCIISEKVVERRWVFGCRYKKCTCRSWLGTCGWPVKSYRS